MKFLWGFGQIFSGYQISATYRKLGKHLYSLPLKKRNMIRQPECFETYEPHAAETGSGNQIQLTLCYFDCKDNSCTNIFEGYKSNSSKNFKS